MKARRDLARWHDRNAAGPASTGTMLSFTQDGRAGWGCLDRDELIDLSSANAPTLRAALTIGLAAAISAGEGGAQFKLAEVQLQQPATDPDKIIGVGINYPSHAQETGAVVPPHPSLFVRFRSSQVAHGEAIVCPRASTQFDYEGELAVIIGQRARHVSEADALSGVAGYRCFAENSARDFQRHSQQVTAGKNFHRSGAFGPWLVTPDELGDLASLELKTRLNGATMQHDRIGHMIFSVPRLIAYISSFTELLPGDVIATGTPDGVGALRKPPVFMKPGDRLEVEISGIGTLTNPLIAETP